MPTWLAFLFNWAVISAFGYALLLITGGPPADLLTIALCGLIGMLAIDITKRLWRRLA